MTSKEKLASYSSVVDNGNVPKGETKTSESNPEQSLKRKDPPDGRRSAEENSGNDLAIDVIKFFSPEDDGHQYGNFRNYYSFHPPTERVEMLSRPRGIFDTLVNAFWAQCQYQNSQDDVIFRYLDVGCNEGDLTMMISKQLLMHLVEKMKNNYKSVGENGNIQQKCVVVATKGVDVDPILIERAERKFPRIFFDEKSSTKMLSNFQKFDVLDAANRVFENTSKRNKIESNSCDMFQSFGFGGDDMVDFTSLFSTTMWIHIHGGDDGLSQVLKWICSLTRHFVLLEPQPSKCYSKAAIRWRRRHGSEAPFPDVSCGRLKLRAKIEEAVNDIMLQNGFEIVLFSDEIVGEEASSSSSQIDNSQTENGEKLNKNRTSWNRSLQLYRRVKNIDTHG